VVDAVLQVVEGHEGDATGGQRRLEQQRVELEFSFTAQPSFMPL